MTEFERKLAHVIAAGIKAALVEPNAEIAALKQQVVELASRPTMQDKGTWASGTTYDEGALVSHGGSAWICSATHFAVGSEPDHQHFRLFVKRGRDGRDGQTVRQLR